jgi:hypothetical protein
VPQMTTSTRNESISGGDACSGPDASDPCKQYTVSLHHTGVVNGTLTWEDRDTWLWLELYGASDGERVTRASSSRVNGLRQEVSINGAAHTQYIVRVRWALGARITPFSLTVTRPN